VGQQAATGAVAGVTSDDSKTKLSSLASTAASAARDEALGPNTDAALQKLLADLDTRIQTLLTNMGATTQGQLNGIITAQLREQIRTLVRQTIDEALGAVTLQEADALREELFGAPLQKNLDALIDSATPHISQVVQQAVQSSVTPLKSEADAEAAKWEPIAIGFAIGAALLVVCLVVLLYALRSHKQVVAMLVKERAPRAV